MARSGKWPTPTARDHRTGQASRIGDPARHGGWNLNDWAAMWPTPQAEMGNPRNHKVWRRPDGQPQNLENAVAARDPDAIGGLLNPTWVEWLQGFPPGWTEI